MNAIDLKNLEIISDIIMNEIEGAEAKYPAGTCSHSCLKRKSVVNIGGGDVDQTKQVV